jgi:hypothetical protein
MTSPSPYQQPYQQIFVSNYLLPAPLPLQPQTSGKKGNKGNNKLKSSSVTNLNTILQGDIPTFIPGAHYFNDGAPAWQRQGTQALNQGAALYDVISSKFDAVVTMIDGENFSGDERDLFVHQPPLPAPQQLQQSFAGGETQGERAIMGFGRDKDKPKKAKELKGDTGCPIASAISSTNYFAKVNLYANSKLPENLPPIKL